MNGFDTVPRVAVFFSKSWKLVARSPSPRNVMRRTFDALGAKLASKSEVEVLWEVSLLVLATDPNTPNGSLWQPSAIVFSKRKQNGAPKSWQEGMEVLILVSETSTQGAEIYVLLCSCLFWLYSYMVVWQKSCNACAPCKLLFYSLEGKVNGIAKLSRMKIPDFRIFIQNWFTT